MNYVPDKYSPDDEVQLVRTPDEILDRPREGTCLDLSLLFCGLCLGCDLVPWLVVLQGHAFVLVSLSHRLREYRSGSRREWKLAFPLTDVAPLRQGLENGTYLAVECTGFARTPALGDHLPEGRGRDADGFLGFEASELAGRAQFGYERRPFAFAIDLPVARYRWHLEPDHLPPPRMAAGAAERGVGRLGVASRGSCPTSLTASTRRRRSATRSWTGPSIARTGPRSSSSRATRTRRTAG